jgi:phosphomannomutase
MNHSPSIEKAQDDLLRAVRSQQITAGAADNIRIWLSEPRYHEFVPAILEHMNRGDWQVLDDVFWTVIPFGTGGRRGKMYPIGCNAINERTIGESAQGLANYIQGTIPGNHSCAIAYDTRHRSELFAKLCAEIMVAAGFHVYLLYPHRSTPQLSFTIRHFRCMCGIMVTASHNPPSDNAVKVYWSSGCQILPPHDKGIIDSVLHVDAIKRVPFDQAVSERRVTDCTAESDQAYQTAVLGQRFPGPRDTRIVYSPLHGVGATAVIPALVGDGFKMLEVFPPHAEPNGDFPNVYKHVANPENPEVFTPIIAAARSQHADLVLASDPDCDRLGCAAPVSCSGVGEWQTLNGNQIGVLLADFVLRKRREAGTLTPKSYVVKTMVTTEMISKIAAAYGVRVFGDLHVGFKWIGGLMDEQGPDDFIFGAEESHGYLVGQYARDKDGAVAAMLMAELAAELKARQVSVWEHLDSLYRQHGYYAESLLNVQMPGSDGMAKMKELMQSLRSDPPAMIGEYPVRRVLDYLNLREICGSDVSPIKGIPGDMVILELESDGNRIAIRPSGTEPKVKYYLFASIPAEQISDLKDTKQLTRSRLERLAKALS